MHRSEDLTTRPTSGENPFASEDARRARLTQIEDARAQWRGYRDAGHFLDLAARQFRSRWVNREYRAIFMGEMWRRRKEGGV